jgi:hypothetical protein
MPRSTLLIKRSRLSIGDPSRTLISIKAETRQQLFFPETAANSLSKLLVFFPLGENQFACREHYTLLVIA